MKHKIIVILKTFRSILYSIYFNFYYLPFKQAIKLPILLYKPKFIKLKGEIIIESSQITTGMIRLGWDSVSLYYPQNRYGIIWENHGGKIIFKGKAIVGSGSGISVGPSGNIDFGNNFTITANAKIISYEKIVFGNYFSGGWDIIIMDTDLHEIIDIKNRKKLKMHSPIIIGEHNWIATRTTVLKSATTPNYCIVAANSVINRPLNIPPYSLVAGVPACLKKTGIYRKDWI